MYGCSKIYFSFASYLCIIVFLIMIIRSQGNPTCYKRSPESSTANCCSLPNFYTERIKEKCNSVEDHFRLDSQNKHLCFISCAFDEIGIFNQNKFQKEILESYLNEAISDSINIKDDIKNYFEICIDNYTELGKIIPKQGYCALYPALVMDCVFIKTFKRCPDSIWSNTDGCNAIRDHWRQCLPDEL